MSDHAPVRTMTCCCCGDYAGRWQQWWNRDTGYGICRKCIDWLVSSGRATGEEILDLYGVEGVNYAPKEV